MKARAKVKNGITEVKVLAKHPMEPGTLPGRPSKKKAHFITNLTASYEGAMVFDGALSAGVSKDPYIKFSFKGGKKGGTVDLKWTDNQGKSESIKAKIK